jgi:hypothetical protein
MKHIHAFVHIYDTDEELQNGVPSRSSVIENVFDNEGNSDHTQSKRVDMTQEKIEQNTTMKNAIIAMTGASKTLQVDAKPDVSISPTIVE